MNVIRYFKYVSTDGKEEFGAASGIVGITYMLLKAVEICPEMKDNTVIEQALRKTVEKILEQIE